MLRGLSVAVLFFILMPLAPAQQPAEPSPEPLEQSMAQAATEAEAVVREVKTFYDEYWQSWRDRKAEGVAAGLAPDFVGLLYVRGQGVVQFDRQKVVGDVQQFFESLGRRDAAWRHQLLAVVPRSSTEAVAAVQNEFSLGEGGGEIELTLEVLRKQPDGRWVLVRKYSEKTPF